MKAISLFTSVLLATTLSFAAGAKDKKSAKAATAAASTTSVDVGGTVKWTGYGVGKSHTGDLQIKSGTVEMKGEEFVGGNFVIDMKSLKTGDSPKLEGHLKSADFFDVEKHPEATFKITKVEAIKGAAAGQPNYKVTGDLTIKGKTNPIDLMTTVTKTAGKQSALATAEIKDRTQYDIVYNSAKFKAASALGDKLIEDKIKLDIVVNTK